MATSSAGVTEPKRIFDGTDCSTTLFITKEDVILKFTVMYLRYDPLSWTIHAIGWTNRANGEDLFVSCIR